MYLKHDGLLASYYILGVVVVEVVVVVVLVENHDITVFVCFENVDCLLLGWLSI